MGKTFSGVLLILLMHSPAGFAMEKSAVPVLQMEQSIAFKEKGDKLLRQGDVDEAITAYKMAATLDNHLCSAWFNMAIACYSKRDMPGAISALERVVRINPKDAEAIYDLGCLRLYDGKAELARREFQRAKSLASVNPTLLARIAKAMRYLDLYQSCPKAQRRLLRKTLQDGLTPLGPI